MIEHVPAKPKSAGAPLVIRGTVSNNVFWYEREQRHLVDGG